jgi:hypothetical protein
MANVELTTVKRERERENTVHIDVVLCFARKDPVGDETVDTRPNERTSIL